MTALRGLPYPLLKLTAEGKIDPSIIITHTLLLSEAARGYDMFANHTENCVKVVLKP